MSITFSCPNCNKSNSFPSDSAGKYAACSQCAMRLQVPLPAPVKYENPARPKKIHVKFKFSYARVLMILFAVVVIAGLAVKFIGDHEPAIEAAAEGRDAAATGGSRVATRAPLVNVEPKLNTPAPATKRLDPPADGLSAMGVEEPEPVQTRPVGKDDDEIQRTLSRRRASQAADPPKSAPPVATTTEKPASEKSAKPRAKPPETKKRRSVAEWRSMIDRAKLLLGNQRWDAAAKILQEVSTEAPAREGAEARVLMRKIPTEFLPKEQ
ncbi:MAG: hypothetical protein AB7O26_12260 [Planctomycetaceae bacterium]